MDWVKNERQNLRCKLGRFTVGGVNFDTLVSMDEKAKYLAWCKLPGIKENLGHFEKQEDARAEVEFAVGVWLGHAMLSEVKSKSNPSSGLSDAGNG